MLIAETPRLRIRNWIDSDRELFHLINSDPQVMEFFPFRRTREDADRFLDDVRESLGQSGFGFACLELKETGQPIGFCGLAVVKIEPAFPAGTIEIGWRLAPPFWGKGYITEAAEALLELGFEQTGLAEIVSFAVPANRRSTSVMERIGLQRDPARDFDHPRVPDDKPHLKRHVVYALTGDAWRAGRKAQTIRA